MTSLGIGPGTFKLVPQSLNCYGTPRPRFSCLVKIWWNVNFFVEVFEKNPNTKFNENLSSGSRVVPFGRSDIGTDLKKITIAFRNFAKKRLKMLEIFVIFVTNNAASRSNSCLIVRIRKNATNFCHICDQQCCITVKFLSNCEDKKNATNFCHICDQQCCITVKFQSNCEDKKNATNFCHICDQQCYITVKFLSNCEDEKKCDKFLSNLWPTMLHHSQIPV